MTSETRERVLAEFRNNLLFDSMTDQELQYDVRCGESAWRSGDYYAKRENKKPETIMFKKAREKRGASTRRYGRRVEQK